MIPDQETERRIRRKHEERAAKEQEEAQKAERLAAMSPLERELEEVREEYPQFEEDQAFLAWLEAVRDGRWGDDPHHRLEVLHQIKVEMEQAGVWRLPSNPKQEKQKKFQRVVEVQRRIEETEAEIAGTLGEHRG